MPARTSAKSGSKKTFRTTDKCVQAEMKNKVEAARLIMQKKILDRQQYYNKFMVEKDKRQATAALVKMRVTSGLSMHGESPMGPKDHTHESSPYFKSYRPLTEKRLIRWRAKEKELQRMLSTDEDILIPPWERDPNEDMSQKFGNMMRALGYSVEDDDVTRNMQYGGVPPAKTSPEPGYHSKRVDPFECLKQTHSDAKVDASSFSCLKPKEFSVSDWTKRTVEDYKEFVTQPVEFTRGRPRRIKSAMPRMQGNQEFVSTGPRTAWTSPSNGQQNVTMIPSRTSSVIIRPHTATGASRYGRSEDQTPHRPSSAGHPAFSGNGVSDAALRTATTRTRSETNSETDNAKGLETVDELDTDVFLQTNDCSDAIPNRQASIKSNSRSTQSSGSIRFRNSMTSSSGSMISADKKESDLERQESDATDGTQRPDSKLSTRDSAFLFGTVLNSSKSRPAKSGKVTFSDEQGEEGRAKTPKQVKSVEQLVNLTKDSSKLASYDIDSLGANLEDISGLRDDHVDELFQKMPKNRNQRSRQEVLLNKAERRIAMHSNRHKKSSDVDALDEILDSDEEDDDESDDEAGSARKMPQWKRELMAEAPPGLFGPKSPSKVVIAMSKAQRKRELDALVTENISDRKKIIDSENARRIRSRLHMYFTMRKMNEAATKISGHTDHG